MYDPTQNPELEKEWQDKAAWKAAAIESQYIVIGPQGAAMRMQDADHSSAIKDWFKETNKVAHITMLINKGFEARNLGEIMFNEKQQTWEKTDNPLVLMSCCGKFLKIWCYAHVTMILQEV